MAIEGGTVTMSGLTLSGGNADEGNGGALLVLSGATVSLSNVTVTNNAINHIGKGGGIYNAGDLKLANVTISNNKAGVQNSTAGGGQGGGIYNAGTLTMGGSKVTENVSGKGEVTDTSSHKPGYGGGVFNASGASAEITSSEIASNTTGWPYGGHGGGFYNDAGATATITDTTVSSNEIPSGSASDGLNDYNAPARGGGIYNGEEAALTLDGVTVSDNVASPRSPNKIANDVADSTANYGGGIYIVDTETSGKVAITNSTISGNYAGSTAFDDHAVRGGGLFLEDSRATLTNVTIANNQIGEYFCRAKCDSRCVLRGFSMR